MVSEVKGRLITLKEAAEMTGYTADYVGQLIRAGKIPGKAVYTNITWMTTAEAILEYKGRKSGKIQPWYTTYRQWGRRFAFDLDLIRLFFQQFRSALPIIAVAFASFLLLVGFTIYILAVPAQVQTQTNINSTTPPPITF
jgi:hypothetical protein